MDNTPNLKLPYIMASQAQKHVTHNDAIRALDALTQIAAQSRTLSEPPLTPIDGSRYIVGETATLDWAGHNNELAAFQDNAWVFFKPQNGWTVWLIDEAQMVVWDNQAWAPMVAGDGDISSIETTPFLGVNAEADINTRLVVASPETLFNHESSDHRLKINKASSSDTASMIFQNNFTGLAEFGLAGDDNWRVKVSDDGNNWRDAIVVDSATGAVDMPNTPIQSNVSPTYFLGYANDANASYLEGDLVSLGISEAYGGADSHAAFDSTTNVYTVPNSGLYQCFVVVNLKAVPAIGRGGIHMARSEDGGITWSNIFKAMANVAANVFGSNTAFVNLVEGDKVALRCNAPSGGAAEFWSNTRLSLTRIV